MYTQLSGLIKYHYDMGFAIGGNPIPDPSDFDAKISDLDTIGKRDAKGIVHRHMVGTKHHIEFKYENIEWEMVKIICANVASKEFFKVTYPDPFEGGTYTMTAYVGDREAKAVWSPTNGVWIGTLSFNLIEK